MIEGLIYKLKELEEELLRKTAEVYDYREENQRLRHLVVSVENELKQKFNDYMKNIMTYGNKPQVEIQSYSHDDLSKMQVVSYKKIFIPSFEIMYVEKSNDLKTKETNYRYLFNFNEGSDK